MRKAQSRLVKVDGKVMDDDQIETMIEECLDELDTNPDEFTEWEQGFIESVDEQQHDRHLTAVQIEKVVQIWERCASR